MSTLLVFLGVISIVIITLAIVKKPSSTFENDPKEKNPYEGKMVRFIHDDTDPLNADGEHGHLEEIGIAINSTGVYERTIKRIIDIILAFGGLLILSPVFLLLCIAIYLDDPGPVFFSQKRVGCNKKFFSLHKFRSMKMSTPHDVPTHFVCFRCTPPLRAGRTLAGLPQGSPCR